MINTNDTVTFSTIYSKIQDLLESLGCYEIDQVTKIPTGAVSNLDDRLSKLGFSPAVPVGWSLIGIDGNLVENKHYGTY